MSTERRRAEDEGVPRSDERREPVLRRRRRRLLDDKVELEGASLSDLRLGGARSAHEPSERLRDGKTKTWTTQATEKQAQLESNCQTKQEDEPDPPKERVMEEST